MPELTHDTAEDGFHELELSGKQLVFLFMMATVVLVAVFLCGVLVGRNARSPRDGEAIETAAASVPAPASVPAEAGPPAAEPPVPPKEDELSYPDRLQGNTPREELKKPKPEPPPPAPQKSTTPPASAVDVPTSGKPGTWFVQVIALQNRAEAANLVKRLIAKGYPAYIELPAAGAPAIYRVRVGRYKDRRDADQAARRLKEEKLTAEVRR